MTPSGRRIDRLARRRRFLAARDAMAAGVHPESLRRAVRAGRLDRITRGWYQVPGAKVSEHHGLVTASLAVPRATICLLSALAFHRVGSQVPSQVWIALDRRARRPAVGWPPLRIVRFSGAALTDGVEVRRLEGQTVRVYSVAKTIADCFKYRNKIGLDVALEALNDAWRARLVTMDEIDRYARICRVARVMRPYLEALVA